MIDVVTAPSISGVSTTPDDVADVPITPWTKSGTYEIVPNITMPISPMQRMLDEDDAVVEDVERQDRLLDAALPEAEDREQDGRSGERAENVLGAPAVLAPAPDEPEQERGRAEREENGPGPVDRVRKPLAAPRHGQGDDEQREPADREVHVEDPAPASCCRR